MADHLLTFELESDKLVLHANRAGLKQFAERLQVLADSTPDGGFEHDHLMTPDWGGSDLTSTAQGDGEVVHHVKVYCWETPNVVAEDREA